MGKALNEVFFVKNNTKFFLLKTTQSYKEIAFLPGAINLNRPQCAGKHM